MTLQAPRSTRNKLANTLTTLLFVHFGDQQMRGSERCLVNLIKAIDKKKFQIVLWCNQQALADMVLADCQETIVSNFSPPYGFGYPASSAGAGTDFLSLLSQSRKNINRLQPALILCNSVAPCQWMVPASLLASVPLVSYHHTTYLPKSRALSMAYGVSHMIGVSNFTLENFLDDGFPKSKSSIIYNGVEDQAPKLTDERTMLREKLGISADAFVIASLCALVPWKKVEVLIESIRHMSEQQSDRRFTLLIIGDGTSMGELKELSCGLNVVFAGWQTNTADYLSIANCLAVAAEKEAFALTIMEAASLGIPTIGAMAGGVREIIVDGENGYFVPPGNASAFAEKFKLLQSQPALLFTLGTNARRMFESSYQVDRMVNELTRQIEKHAVPEERKISMTLRRTLRLAYYPFKLLLKRALGIRV